MHPLCLPPDNEGIDCAIKLKVKDYLTAKEERDKKYTGQLFPEKVLRA